MMAVSADQQSLKKDFSTLEKRRRGLKQSADIIRAIESMQQGLRAVLLMGSAFNDLPWGASNASGEPGNPMGSLPLGRIEEFHRNLELIVNKQLNRVLNYAGVDFSSAAEVEFITHSSELDPQSPVALLRAFQRTAQTAVSLRLLMRQQGVRTPGSQLPVANEVLERRLTHLDQQHAVQWENVERQIGEARVEIVHMIGNVRYVDAMREILHEVVMNLDRDRQLLAEDAPIECLSFMARTEEIERTKAANVATDEFDMESLVPVKPGLSKRAVRWFNDPREVSRAELGDKGQKFVQTADTVAETGEYSHKK